MPKLWTDTIEGHRAAVRDATFDAMASLVARHGIAGVTMSQVAAATGIGRATLYKYFPDIDAILLGWHERQVGTHLEQLRAIAAEPGTPEQRLAAVLMAYARLSRVPHGPDGAALLHRAEHVHRAQRELRELLIGLLRDAARAGSVRNDLPLEELAVYCLRALTAASELPSGAAIDRLVALVLASLKPPSPLKSKRAAPKDGP